MNTKTSDRDSLVIRNLRAQRDVASASADYWSVAWGASLIMWLLRVPYFLAIVAMAVMWIAVVVATRRARDQHPYDDIY